MIFCSLVSRKFLYQAREWSVMYLYVRGISILSLSTSLILDFRNIRTVFFFVLFHDCSFHCFIVQKYLCSWISIKFILLQCWTIQYRVMSIWSKSHLSLAPQYWYVAAWEIWRKHITGHMRVTLCHEYLINVLYRPIGLLVHVVNKAV